MISELKHKKIGVLLGGESRERDISLRSGSNVYVALKNKGYDVIKIDTKYTWDFSKSIDVAFIALHGQDGEDGTMQALLETQNIPFTGSGVSASIIGMNKLLTKKICDSHQLPTPTYEKKHEPFDGLSFGNFPLILKPLNSGSSIDVFLVYTKEECLKASTHLTNTYGVYLVEEFIDGQEISVSVLENPDLFILPILELVPKKSFYDFECKYTEGMTSFILPANLNSKYEALVHHYTKQIFKACGCSSFGRIDMRVCPKRGPFILEVNTVPGLTNLSDLPASAHHAGILFDDLIEMILNSAVTKQISPAKVISNKQ